MDPVEAICARTDWGAVADVSLLAITVKVTSPGPVFAVQDHVGRNGRRCRIYRFRAKQRAIQAVGRRSTNELGTRRFKPIDVSSLTPIGSFLRETRLEELPLLWNVLRGDLSLAMGPLSRSPRS